MSKSEKIEILTSNYQPAVGEAIYIKLQIKDYKGELHPVEEASGRKGAGRATKASTRTGSIS